MNWLDITIFILLVLYILDGYRRGLLEVIIELISFGLSLLVAWASAQPLGDFIGGLIRMNLKSYKPIGFLVAWVITQIILSILLRIAYKFLPTTWRQAKWNKIAGILPSLAKGIILVMVVLAFLVSVPFKTDKVSNGLDKSFIARGIGHKSADLLKDVFVDGIGKSTFITLVPEKIGNGAQYQILDPNQRVTLDFTLATPRIDEKAEVEMLKLINSERVKAGLKPLAADPEMQQVARAHAADMYAKGYFSHVNLEGLSPFDRMEREKVKYVAAGENLAFAVDVQEAHKGLMNSPGHRANILEPKFGRVGIGILYGGGQYEEMFVQNFRN